MSIFVLIGIVIAICKTAEYIRQRRAAEERERIMREQQRQREYIRQQQAAARECERRQAALEREQIRLAKEQEKQAAQIAKHEDEIRKLNSRLSAAEGEIAFNREQRERLWKLLEIEQLERDSAIPNSKTWQKHQRKVISLENQIHTVQKRIDKAHMDKAYCESKMAS